MAPFRHSVTRQPWLLFALSLIFLVAYLAKFTPTCKGKEAKESPVTTHVSRPRGHTPNLSGDNFHAKYQKAWREPGALPELPAGLPPTDSHVSGVTGKCQTKECSFTSTEAVSNQSPTSTLDDDASSHVSQSPDITSSPGPLNGNGRVAAFRSPHEDEESNAAAHLRNLSTQTDGDLHFVDHSLISLPARASEEAASLNTAPATTPNITGVTKRSTASASPPASTKGFRGAKTPSEHVVQLLLPPEKKTVSPPEGLVDLRLRTVTNPTDVVRNSAAWRSAAVGETTLGSRERGNDELSSAAMIGSPRYLHAGDSEERLDGRYPKESAQRGGRIQFLQAEVTKHASDFEAAAQRACSPSNYAKYVDIVQDQMDDALDDLEDFIDNVTSDWLEGAFGYEDLQALLQNKITVLEYVKKNHIFLTLVCAALVLLFLWLFCCVPKICCRCCRRLCFCIPERKHKLGFMGRLIVTIIGAAALLTIVVFAILAAASQYNGVGGVRALNCHLFTTVGEIINGSNTTTVDPNEQFVGVTPLFRELREVSAKLDTNSPQSIVTDIRTQVTTDLDFSKGIATSKGYLDALRQALNDASKKVESFYHICQACAVAKSEQPVGEALDFLQKALSSSQLDMSQEIENLFNQFTFPSVVLDNVIPVEEVEEVLKRVTDKLTEVEPPITSGLMYTDVVFGVAYAFVFLMACVGVAWIVFFFLRGAKSGSTPACLQWNVLCFSIFLILLVAGILGFATNTALRGCEYVNKELVVDDNWDDLIRKIDPDNGYLGQLVRGCFGSAAVGNLVDILGYRAEYDKMIEQVDSALDDLLTEVPSPPPVSVQDQVNTVRTVIRDYGWAATANPASTPPPNSVPEERLNTFAEFLSSGVQLEDKTFKTNLLTSRAREGSSVTLYGLRSLEKLVHPWKFAAIRGKDPDDKFLISDTYPLESDLTFKAWLREYENGLKAKAGPQESAEADTKSRVTKMKNAIWWSVQKHKVLFNDYKCPDYDPLTNKVTQRSCSGQTFFAYTPYDWSKSYVVGTAEKLLTTVTSLAEKIQNAPATASANASSIILDMLKKVKGLVKGLNCKFMRRGFVAGTDIACNNAFHPIHKGSLYSIITCAGMLVWTLLLLIIWRKLKDNATLTKHS